MARSVAVIDLRRLWEPERPAQLRRPKGARKTCRRDVKQTLKTLKPSAMTAEVMIRRDDITFRFLQAKCDACRRCPKVMSRLGLTPPGPGRLAGERR